MSYFKVLSRHWLRAGVSFRFCETQISVARKALHVDFAPISVRQSNIAVLRRRTAMTCAYRGFHFPSTPVYIFICCLFNNTVSSQDCHVIGAARANCLQTVTCRYFACTQG